MQTNSLAFPWHPVPGDRLHRDIEAFSWYPFQFARRQPVSACSGSPPQCSRFSSYTCSYTQAILKVELSSFCLSECYLNCRCVVNVLTPCCNNHKHSILAGFRQVKTLCAPENFLLNGDDLDCHADSINAWYTTSLLLSILPFDHCSLKPEVWFQRCNVTQFSFGY